MSETSGDLLGFATPESLTATGDAAFLQAMLDVEAALARAVARAGLIPAGAAEAIAACCHAGDYDLAGIAARAMASATPVVPLVADLTARVPASAAPYVHLGATSQDIMDTAMCLVAARVLDSLGPDIVVLADRLDALADAHRGTLQIGRTLLQHAAPTTFGLACAGWLTAVDEATTTLVRVRRERLAVQLGGPVGTVAALGEHGRYVASTLATELGLACPTLPWHTDRGRILDLAAALGGAAAALATIALDVTLLAQPEIAEVAEGTPGGSSAMPHKRNPARAVIVTAVTHRAPGLVASLFAGAPQELQRAAGRWQAEWPVLTELLRVTATAAFHGRTLVEGLRVDVARMRANLDAAGDLLLAESVAARLAPALGRTRAHALVIAAADRARHDATTLRVALTADAEVTAVLSAPELDEALRPEAWLGSADTWIDRARGSRAGNPPDQSPDHTGGRR